MDLSRRVGPNFFFFFFSRMLKLSKFSRKSLKKTDEFWKIFWKKYSELFSKLYSQNALNNMKNLPTSFIQLGHQISSPFMLRNFYAHVKGHLEPTHLKSSPLLTFSTKSLGQDSPSVHLFSKIIGSRFTTAKIKLGEDSPSWSVFF